jgi:RNase P subunit RPR2
MAGVQTLSEERRVNTNMTENTNEPISRDCKDCRVIFQLEAGEVRWYDAHKLPTPVRCKQCRDERRWKKQTRTKA